LAIWLSNLKKESGISAYKLTDYQKEEIWNNFGGSPGEII